MEIRLGQQISRVDSVGAFRDDQLLIERLRYFSGIVIVSPVEVIRVSTNWHRFQQFKADPYIAGSCIDQAGQRIAYQAEERR